MMLCDKEQLRMFTDQLGHGHRGGGMDREREEIPHMEYPWVSVANDLLQAGFEVLDLCLEERLCSGCRNFASFQGLDFGGAVIEVWDDDIGPIGECISADFYHVPSQTRER